MKHMLILLFPAVFLLACNKNSGPGTMRITVVNEDGVPIQNCNVKLSYPGSLESEWGVDYFLATTDVDGVIEFRLDVNAYFDAYVYKGFWEGCDFVEFEPGKDKNKRIIIYPPGSVFNGCI
jgi:hypothetical protein